MLAANGSRGRTDPQAMRGTLLSLLVGSALVLEAAAFLPALQRPFLAVRSLPARNMEASSPFSRRGRASLTTPSMSLEPMTTFIPTLLQIAEETTYSKASYYTTLFLYVISFPGLISLVTRSTKTKNVRRTFLTEGPSNGVKPKELKQAAGEVMAYFLANNYIVADNQGSTVTFRGQVGKSKSQAFFLSFCTFLGLGSLALVLSIQFQEIGQNWFYITLLSPYAGVYYWNKPVRTDEVSVRLEIDDSDSTMTEIVAEGGKEELERFAETLKLQEKGMIRVKGIFERE